MESVRKLCSRTVVLSKGGLVADGTSEDSINEYIGGIYKDERKYEMVEWKNPKDAPGGDIIRLKSACTKNIKNEICSKFDIIDKIIIQIEFWVLKDNYQVCNTIGLTAVSSKTHTENGGFYVLDDYIKGPWGGQSPFNIGMYLTELEIPGDLLNEGIYSLIVDPFIPPADPDSSYQIRKHNVLSFEIIDNHNPDSARGSYPYDWQAGSSGYLLRPKLNITTKRIEGE
jgi:hypothetical protein